jgi:glycosyltransferase involved in cell wall biosynthesis
MYGPGIAAHPYENEFWGKANIQLMLISCEWFQQMYNRYLPIHIPTKIWPAGIETDIWHPPLDRPRSLSLLIYDKVRWRRDEYEPKLIEPIRRQLESFGIRVEYLRYGFYDEDDYHKILQRVNGMVFLCEHETQGFAYLQALSCGVPILAWDRGGYWQDPSMFPDRVKFEPVTSVPYFDQRCGEKFKSIEEFSDKLEKFLDKLNNQYFAPREYILDNLTLEKCAQKYLDILSSYAEG